MWFWFSCALVAAATVGGGTAVAWRMGGYAHVLAELTAAGAVAVTTAMLWVWMRRTLRRGGPQAAGRVLLVGSTQAPLCLAAAAGGSVALGAPLKVVMVWTAVFFCVALVLKVFFLKRQLRHVTPTT